MGCGDGSNNNSTIYNCPGPGEQGHLMFYIQYGHNIKTDQYGESDAYYVKIEAVSSEGSVFTKLTSTKRNPTWNEAVFFGDREWQFFRIRVWSSSREPAGDLVTVPLLDQSRTTRRLQHCTDASCSGYIMYHYKLYRLIHGRLEVRLREQEGGKTGKEKSSRQSIVLTTMTPSGSFTSYTLEKANRWITISGCSFADLVKFDIIDTDDSLAQTQDSQFIDISAGHCTYCLPDVSFICRTYSPQRLDVRLTPDRDECDYYNPCLNGGTCIDGCGTYACSCSSSFTGSLCQYENRVD